MTARTNHRIGTYAGVAAVAAAVLSPLLALSYFATADGAESLAMPTVAAWAEPARDVFRPLVTFAGADRVYATYTQALALLFPAVVLTAVATRSQRPLPRKRSERVGWAVALMGYSLFAVGLLVMAIGLIGGDTSVAFVDIVFMAAVLPGLLLGLIGSTILGVVFLRSGYRPRATAWLLALAIPFWIVGSFVLGHNSVGILPLFAAWAVTGQRWRKAETDAAMTTEGDHGLPQRA